MICALILALGGLGAIPSGSGSHSGGLLFPNISGTPRHPKFQQAPDGYFDDALFIGDSRTVGIENCEELDGATFFAITGMSIKGTLSEKTNIPGCGNIGLKTLLRNYSFGKVYITLGVNDIASKFSDYESGYREIFDLVRSTQPDALIYIQANLHVKAGISRISNAAIDRMNKGFSEYADNETVFYIDPNIIFDDEDGNLAAEFTGDGIHLTGTSYADWAKWIADNVIIPR